MSVIIYDVRFVDGNGLQLESVVSYPGLGVASSDAGSGDTGDGEPGAAAVSAPPPLRWSSARNGARMFFQVTRPGPVTVAWRATTGAQRMFQVFVTRSMVDQPVQLPIGQELVNSSAGGGVEVTVTAERAGDSTSIVAHLGFTSA